MEPCTTVNSLRPRQSEDGHRSPPTAQPARGAGEGGVAEGEDPAVGGDEPVPLAARRRRHADDRPVEGGSAGGAVERRVAEGEDPPVRGDEPVTGAGGGGRHADDGPVQGDATGGAVE